MTDFLTYEEALAIIRPNKKNTYSYSQTRINQLIKSGDLVKPQMFVKGKDGELIEVPSASLRYVTADSVEVFAKKNRYNTFRPITIFYNDGTKKHFKSIKKAMEYYDVYYSKIANVLNTSITVEVPLIGERIKIVHEDTSNTSITTEFINFRDSKIGK